MCWFWVRDLKLANRIVRRTLRIIRYLRPERWFLENPQTGLLKHQPQMRRLPFVDVDYCRFSNWKAAPVDVWRRGAASVIENARAFSVGVTRLDSGIVDSRLHMKCEIM